MMCFSWTLKLHHSTACKVYMEIDNTPCNASCFGWSVLQQLLLNSVLRNVACGWSNMGLNLMVEFQWIKGWGKMSDSELSDSRMFPHTQNFWLLYSRIHLIWHLWTRQHTHWTNFLKSNILLLLLYWAAELSRGVFHLYVICRCWCFKICSQASKNVQMSVTFISLQTDWTFLIITGWIMGFPSECITLNRLYNTLFICATLGSFMSFTLNGSSHFHLIP